MIGNRAKLMYINDNEEKNISEWNLLHDIINPPKNSKNIDSHYSLILHPCMNTKKWKRSSKNSEFY